MARIRTIKPEFFTSEDIVSLSPMARLLYIALWCEADREGRMMWKPKTFKLRYLPADNCDVEALCAEIVDRGLVKLYGEGLAYVPAFSEHQHINPRESVSSLPVPDASPRVRTRQPRDSDAQVGREGKGKEGVDDASRDAKSADADLFSGVSPQVVSDFKALRKAKKAAITQTAVDGIRREAGKAGLSLGDALAMCCERGWTGFKAEWVNGSGGRNGVEAAALPRLQA